MKTEAMPTIAFGKDCDYDTLHSVMTGWAVRVWLPDAILTAVWKGSGENGDTTVLSVWSRQDDDYTNRVVIETDAILKIEVI